MTEASTGLRKALARNAGVSKLTAEELLAQMSDEQKTALAASLAPAPAPAAAAAASEAPAAGAEDDEDGDDLEMGDKKKAKKKDGDEYMGDDKAKAAVDRVLAVASCEHFAANKAAATVLLANDKLSADEIIGLLAALNPVEASAEAAEAAARADMKAALQSAAASSVEANDGGSSTNPAASAEAVWDHARAKVFGNNNAA